MALRTRALPHMSKSVLVREMVFIFRSFLMVDDLIGMADEFEIDRARAIPANTQRKNLTKTGTIHVTARGFIFASSIMDRARTHRVYLRASARPNFKDAIAQSKSHRGSPTSQENIEHPVAHDPSRS